VCVWGGGGGQVCAWGGLFAASGAHRLLVSVPVSVHRSCSALERFVGLAALTLMLLHLSSGKSPAPLQEPVASRFLKIRLS
jgi:hypothetical protein